MTADLAAIRAALTHAERVCRFHGADFERLGMAYGEPRCDSCKQPYRVVRALAALDRLDDTGPPVRGAQIGNGDTQSNVWGR